MIEKVSMIISLDGYSMIAYKGNDLPPRDFDLSAGHYSDFIAINHQRWQLQTPPFSELISGHRWDELGIDLSANLIEALERVSVACSKLARRLSSRHYDPLANSFTITIYPGRVEAKARIDTRFAGQSFSEFHCRYEWDENRQLLPLQVLEGDAQFVPQSFLTDFKDACFGRYGLLARVLERSLQTAPQLDDMGAMRWA